MQYLKNYIHHLKQSKDAAFLYDAFFIIQKLVPVSHIFVCFNEFDFIFCTNENVNTTVDINQTSFYTPFLNFQNTIPATPIKNEDKTSCVNSTSEYFFREYPLLGQNELYFGKLGLIGTELTEIDQKTNAIVETLVKQLAFFIYTNAAAFNTAHTLQSHLDNSHLAIVEWNQDFAISNWSKKAETLFGWKAIEVMGVSFLELDFMLPYFKELLLQAKPDQSLKSTSTSIIEYKHRNKQGQILFCRWHISLKNNKAGNLHTIFSMVEDITAIRKVQDRLKESEERFSLAMDGSNDGLWDWKIKEDLAYFSPRFRQMVGYDSKEYIGGISALQQAVHPDDFEGTMLAIQSYFENKTVFYHEFRLKITTGEYRWFLVRGQAIWNEDGEPVRMTGSLTDINDNKKVTENLISTNIKLIKSSAQLTLSDDLNKAIIAAIPDLIFRVSVDGTFLNCYFSDASILAMKPHLFIGKKIDEILLPSTFKIFNTAISNFQQSKNLTTFTYPLLINNVEKHFEGRLTMINESDYLFFIRDITNEKNTVQQNQYKTELLSVVAKMGIQLLNGVNLEKEIYKSFEDLGNVLKVDRIYYVEKCINNKTGINELILNKQLHWVAPNSNLGLNQSVSYFNQLENCPSFLKNLMDNHIFTNITSGVNDDDFNKIVRTEGVKSMIAIPIFFNNKFAGFIGIDECKYERVWSEDELSILQIAIGIITANLQSKIDKNNIEKVNERFSLAMRATNDLIWDLDIEHNIIDRSENGFEKITGFRYDEIIQTVEFWSSRLHPDDINVVANLLKESLSNPNTTYLEIEHRFLRKDESYGFLIDRCYIIRNLEGKAIRVIGAVQDITASKSAAIQLENSELRFKSMIHNINDIITLVDHKGIISYYSASALRILGYTLNEMLGCSLSQLVHPDDLIIIETSIKSSLTTKGQTPLIEFRCLKKDGDYIMIESSFSNQLDNPVFNAFIVISRDISERKKAENMIKSSEEKFRFLVHNIVDIISIIKTDGTIIYQSSSAKQVMGYQENELSNRNITEVIHPEDLPKMMYSLKNLIEHGGVSDPIEVRLLNSDGNYIIIEAQGSNQLYNPLIGGIVINSRDISARKKIEIEKQLLIDELTRNNADLKQFSYIVSHNLRSPLTNLMSMIKLFDYSSVKNERSLKLLDGFKVSTIKLNETLNDLIDILLVKNNNNTQVQELDIQEVLNQVVSSLKSLVDNSKILINTDFKEAPLVNFTKPYLESVLQNLLTNSIKYASTIRTPIVFICSKKINNGILLTYSDNGIGFNIDLVKDKIFGLHQRFHHHPNSRGVGLYLIHSQITSMGGSIEVNSEEGVGTVFSITFKSV